MYWDRQEIPAKNYICLRSPRASGWRKRIRCSRFYIPSPGYHPSPYELSGYGWHPKLGFRVRHVDLLRCFVTRVWHWRWNSKSCIWRVRLRYVAHNLWNRSNIELVYSLKHSSFIKSKRADHFQSFSADTANPSSLSIKPLLIPPNEICSVFDFDIGSKINSDCYFC